MAYIGTINMILITILLSERSMRGGKGRKLMEHRVPLELWLPVILKMQVNRHRRHDGRDEGRHSGKREEDRVQCGAGTWPVVVFNGYGHLWREIRERFPGDTGEGEAFLKPGSLWDGGLRGRGPHARAAAIRQPD